MNYKIIPHGGGFLVESYNNDGQFVTNEGFKMSETEAHVRVDELRARQR